MSICLERPIGNLPRCWMTAASSAPATPNTAPDAPTDTPVCPEKCRLSALPTRPAPKYTTRKPRLPNSRVTISPASHNAYMLSAR